QPATATTVVGDQITLSAAFVSSQPMTYQWQAIRGGTTNPIAGATDPTLTLTNLQLTNTASYRLVASNALGVAVSAPGSLTVSPVPAAVNQIITTVATQTGLGSGTFTPGWAVVTNGSLIAGKAPSLSSGNFSMEVPGRSVNSLTDGGSSSLARIPATSGYSTTTNYVTCGNGNGAGSFVIYSFTKSAVGYNVTNIVVYGGWADAGRDQQAYTIYYATATAPTNFIPLTRVDVNPSNPANAQSATRVALTPVTGALATNVAAVKFDFTTPTSENGYCGYAEIVVSGFPTPVVAPVATNPTNITFQLAAKDLLLNWPGDHIGWRLQVQTNELDQGLGTNWVDVAGAIGTNQVNVPIHPAGSAVFFRMIYP
ncbi:MAG TPA: hypothetical protein VNZ22_16820, partial [Bacillota bacterium]|nr:hypothetical protein [Bacillota bacterium]